MVAPDSCFREWPNIPYSAAAATFAPRNAGITSFANRSSCSSASTSGVPSGMLHTTRSVLRSAPASSAGLVGFDEFDTLPNQL